MGICIQGGIRLCVLLNWASVTIVMDDVKFPVKELCVWNKRPLMKNECVTACHNTFSVH